MMTYDTERRSSKLVARYEDRITATEWIGATQYVITLEQDHTGRYREVAVAPIEETVGIHA